MTQQTQQTRQTHRLDLLTPHRQQAGEILRQIAIAIDHTETTETSGQLGLTPHSLALNSMAEQLQQGTYRIVVLGEMKRGKSTLINALVGETLLPSDVNPCTALLSLLRHGPERQVTLHYSDGKAPNTIDFDTFRSDYTIPPEAARQLETRAFPDISHVVIECPAPLLASGLELIDTPGLNDTETRNQQVLTHLHEAQAVVFVLDAIQPITLDEQRYLRNYVHGNYVHSDYMHSQDRPCFYIVNGWDRIRAGLMDPEDPVALSAAIERQRQAIAQGLPQGATWFEVSALTALRQQRQGDALTGSGVDQFLMALESFLLQQRGQTELERAAHLVNRVYHAVQAAVARRMTLLDEDLNELQQRLGMIEVEFSKLEKIQDKYRQLIQTQCDRSAHAIAESFKTYILNLESTFEADFIASQPDLDFLSFLDENQRETFYQDFKRAFERYLNDRLAAWELTAQHHLAQAFEQLSDSATGYQVAYTDVVDAIYQKMMGDHVYAPNASTNTGNTNARPWTDTIRELFDQVPNTLNNSVQSVQPLNRFWKSVLQTTISSVCVAIILQTLSLIFSSLFLNIIGVIAALGGILAVQAEVVRQQFITTTRQEFSKHLPQIAAEQWQPIYQAVQACFDRYEQQAMQTISGDIAARRLELSSLVEQKQQNKINREQTAEQLKNLEESILQHLKSLQELSKQV